MTNQPDDDLVLVTVKPARMRGKTIRAAVPWEVGNDIERDGGGGLAVEAHYRLYVPHRGEFVADEHDWFLVESVVSVEEPDDDRPDADERPGPSSDERSSSSPAELRIADAVEIAGGETRSAAVRLHHTRSRTDDSSGSSVVLAIEREKPPKMVTVTMPESSIADLASWFVAACPDSGLPDVLSALADRLRAADA